MGKREPQNDMHPKSKTNFWRCIFFMRKKGTKNKKCSPEFKLSVILDMREHRFSCCEAVRKYNLGSTRTGGAIQILQRWECKYLSWHIDWCEKRGGHDSSFVLQLFARLSKRTSDVMGAGKNILQFGDLFEKFPCRTAEHCCNLYSVGYDRDKFSWCRLWIVLVAKNQESGVGRGAIPRGFWCYPYALRRI